MTQSPCLPELPKPAELLSCPFCGGAAHCHDYRGGAGYWQVECQDCDATTDGRRIKSDAIEVWNRRACYEAGSAAADQCRQCQCPACTSGTTHASDCSVHGYDSGAGILRGPCDCGAAPTQGAEGAAPQAVGHVDYSALEGPLEELVRYCNNDDMLCNASEVIAAEAALETVYKARIAAQCVCQACKNGTIHASDCSVHGSDSGSGIARGPCDCGAALTPSPTPTALQEADALREALTELVALKDMKERIELIRAGHTFMTDAQDEADSLEQEYGARKPLAWAAARAALAQHQPQQGEQR